MLKSIQQRDKKGNRWIKITMSVILGLICISMVLYLIPGLMSGNLTAGGGPDAIATVGSQDIALTDAQQQLDAQLRNQTIPPHAATDLRKANRRSADFFECSSVRG